MSITFKVEVLESAHRKLLLKMMVLKLKNPSGSLPTRIPVCLSINPPEKGAALEKIVQDIASNLGHEFAARLCCCRYPLRRIFFVHISL